MDAHGSCLLGDGSFVDQGLMLKYMDLRVSPILRTLIGVIFKANKGAKIRNRYNQVPHLTQDTNGKVTNAQLDTTNESQEVSPFLAGDHKAHINRGVQRHCKHKTEKNLKDPQRKYRLGTVSKIFYWRALTSLTAPTSPYIQI